MKYKGPVIYNQEERITILKAVKWVDEVVVTDDYLVSIDYLKSLKADYILHGGDIIKVDGKSIYDKFDDLGMLKIYKRTHGISSTSILNNINNIFKNKKVNKNSKYKEINEA